MRAKAQFSAPRARQASRFPPACVLFSKPLCLVREKSNKFLVQDLPDPPGNRSIPLLVYANSSFLSYWSPEGGGVPSRN